MPTVAFATYGDLPDLDPDDRRLIAPLAERGVSVVPAVWNDPAFNWDRPDLVVLRSCWDYHLDVHGFRGWLDLLQTRNIRVANEPSVLRWNLDKQHLRQLAERGVSVPTTVWTFAGERAPLRSILDGAGIESAVVKPTVSLSAYRTWRTHVQAIDEERWKADATTLDLMVQRFVPEIETDGEWSLIFFDGAFSHASIKRPKAGDFRVQSEHGGSNEPAAADATLIAWAENVLATIHGLDDSMRREFLYARVDAIRTSKGFMLMEVELIDPSLYFHSDADAVIRAADAIVARVRA